MWTSLAGMIGLKHSVNAFVNIVVPGIPVVIEAETPTTRRVNPIRAEEDAEISSTISAYTQLGWENPTIGDACLAHHCGQIYASARDPKLLRRGTNGGFILIGKTFLIEAIFPDRMLAPEVDRWRLACEPESLTEKGELHTVDAMTRTRSDLIQRPAGSEPAGLCVQGQVVGSYWLISASPSPQPSPSEGRGRVGVSTYHSPQPPQRPAPCLPSSH